MTDRIAIEDVTKRFRHVVALDRVSFGIPAGEIFGLLGPNGAGKTTLMRILTGILGPDEGQVHFYGGQGKPSKERIGYLPEERGLYPKMTVSAFVDYCAALKGLSKPERTARLQEGLERLELQQHENHKIEELSKGNQQRVQVLITMLHRPDILILDEPFTGLDPIASDRMKRILREEAERGCSVLISTHRMEDAEELCSHIALIYRGRVIREGALAEIKRAEGRDELVVEYRGDAPDLPNLPGVCGVEIRDHSLHLQLQEEGRIPEIVRTLAERVEIDSVTRYAPTLHDIFVSLVGGEIEEESQ